MQWGADKRTSLVAHEARQVGRLGGVVVLGERLNLALPTAAALPGTEAQGAAARVCTAERGNSQFGEPHLQKMHALNGGSWKLHKDHACDIRNHSAARLRRAPACPLSPLTHRQPQRYFLLQPAAMRAGLLTFELAMGHISALMLPQKKKRVSGSLQGKKPAWQIWQDCGKAIKDFFTDTLAFNIYLAGLRPTKCQAQLCSTLLTCTIGFLGIMCV